MQPYLWQQAGGKRHVYSTSDYYPIVPGKSFTALCGADVTTTSSDLTQGCWFDPECEDCLMLYVKVSGWTDKEIENMAAIRAAVDAKTRSKGAPKR